MFLNKTVNMPKYICKSDRANIPPGKYTTAGVFVELSQYPGVHRLPSVIAL